MRRSNVHLIDEQLLLPIVKMHFVGCHPIAVLAWDRCVLRKAAFAAPYKAIIFVGHPCAIGMKYEVVARHCGKSPGPSLVPAKCVGKRLPRFRDQVWSRLGVKRWAVLRDQVWSRLIGFGEDRALRARLPRQKALS